MAQPQSFIGARISLTSVADIRYKGILMGINHVESTIQLSDVISMGTESRRPPAEFIPPSDTSYGTVVFRATEVKDLAIDPTPPTAGLFRDPAVLGAGPQPQGPYGGYPPQPPYGQMPMGGPGPPSGHRGMNGPPPHVPAGYPQPPQQHQRFMNAQEQQHAQAPVAAAAVGKSPVPPAQAPAQATVPQTTEAPATRSQQPAAPGAAPTHTSDPVRSASVTLEKVERAMDELRAQPAPAASAGPATHSGRGGRRGGRGGGGGGQSASARVQVPDTEFDFEAMNAKFDKASLRPNESESDSESDNSEDRAPDEPDKKDKTGKFYNPQRSFFDDISSDSNLKDGGNPRGRARGRGGALGRQRREEERNRNLSTFGETGVGAGHNAFGYGGFPGGQGGPGGGRGRRRWGVEYDDSDAGSVIDMSIGQTSAASVYSFSSSRDGSAMLREAEGRIFNSQNELYYLPADELEYSRLDKQHLVHLLSNDGLVHKGAIGHVRAALDPNNLTSDGSPRRVLDLGCGGGNWAISMALEYPHVEVVGVDLAPNTTRPPPPNCRFEFDDFNLGMSHYHGMFDVVHARSSANGVTDFKSFVNDMGLCLRPGGVILIIEGDLQLCSYTREPQEIAYGDGDPNKSWMARMLWEAFTTMKARGSHVDANVKLHGWLCENPLFQDQDWAKIFSPIGPWERGRTAAESRKLETIGELMRQNSLAFVRALKPLLLAEGYFPETVDRFIAGTDKELGELSVHMYVQWHYVWATRKPDTDSTLRPPDEQVATLSGTGSVSGPSTISAMGSPLAATPLTTAAQPIVGSSGQHRGMFIVPPSTMGSLSQQERMADVGMWAAASHEESLGNEPNSGSENDSDEEFMDANSDGDTDIESVTDI